MIKVMHIDHIALTVRDLARSKQWYCEVLGMEENHPDIWGGVPVLLSAGDTKLALFPASTRKPAAMTDANDTITMRHFAFRVDYATFLFAQDVFCELGIDYEFQDHDICHSLYFSDPDGHRLELTTYELP